MGANWSTNTKYPYTVLHVKACKKAELEQYLKELQANVFKRAVLCNVFNATKNPTMPRDEKILMQMFQAELVYFLLQHPGSANESLTVFMVVGSLEVYQRNEIEMEKLNQ
jgi:hypothetical protein